MCFTGVDAVSYVTCEEPFMGTGSFPTLSRDLNVLLPCRDQLPIIHTAGLLGQLLRVRCLSPAPDSLVALISGLS